MRKATDARSIAELGILTAVALVLGYLEHLIPLTSIPGIKLGLANTTLLYALYRMDEKRAAFLLLLKVGLSGLLFGGVSAMLYSFAGGALSLGAMAGLRRASCFGVIGVSVAGAICHNAGQTLMARLVTGSPAVWGYLPVLLVAAVVTGSLTGIVAKLVLKALKGTGARQDT